MTFAQFKAAGYSTLAGGGISLFTWSDSKNKRPTERARKALARKRDRAKLHMHAAAEAISKRRPGRLPSGPSGGLPPVF